MDESRREFLKTGAKVVAVATAAERLRTWSTPGNVLGANDRVRVAIVGLRGRGENHIQGYGALPNVEIAALCDVDDNVMRERLPQVQKLGFQPKTYTDVRSCSTTNPRRRVHCHTAPLACAHCHLGVPGGERRVCREALFSQSMGGQQLVRAAQNTTASCSMARRRAQIPR